MEFADHGAILKAICKRVGSMIKKGVCECEGIQLEVWGAWIANMVLGARLSADDFGLLMMNGDAAKHEAARLERLYGNRRMVEDYRFARNAGMTVGAGPVCKAAREPLPYYWEAPKKNRAAKPFEQGFVDDWMRDWIGHWGGSLEKPQELDSFTKTLVSCMDFD